MLAIGPQHRFTRGWRIIMPTARPPAIPAAAAGTITIGGDLTVNRMGFGAMRLTGKGIWGPPRNPEGAVRVLQRAVELGVNFFDTADSYGPHVAEELIAEALYPYPGLVIATKGGVERPGPNRWGEWAAGKSPTPAGGESPPSPVGPDRAVAAPSDRSQS